MIRTVATPQAPGWLYHYEVCLVTGEWTDGGIGHDAAKEAA